MPGKPGYLPCFEHHRDKKFPIGDFFGNDVFCTKTSAFLGELIQCQNILDIGSRVGGYVQVLNPKDTNDRKVCKMVSWETSKVYRVDFGKNKYRLLFAIDNKTRRCHILALDAKHQTFRQH